MADYPFIPDKVKVKAAQLGIKEEILYDVYFNGNQIKLTSGIDAMIKQYSSTGYTIGVTYVRNEPAGEYVITGVWKR